MRRRDVHHPTIAGGPPSLISTDVFDTLLLRTWRSERSRIAAAERRFAAVLDGLGYRISPAQLIHVRLQAQSLAFRALNVGGRAGEVSLSDIVDRQLKVLGIDGSLLSERLRIELEVEKESLFPNSRLAGYFRERRSAGTPIVAISDTTLSGKDVQDLIEHFHGPDLVHRVYTSADLNLTKRGGALFAAVSQAEKVDLGDMLHFGDDPLADVKMPAGNGMRAEHTPRGRHHGYARRADGAWTVLRQHLAVRPAAAVSREGQAEHIAFGREIFGPIVTQFAIRMWLYAAEALRGGKPVLLFCARGGIGIRAVFEEVLSRLDLPLNVPRQNLMVSRLIAARAALLNRSRSAIQELDREFAGRTMADVARALGGQDYPLAGDWLKPFDGRAFVELLHAPAGSAVLADIEKQNTLFRRHLDDVAGEADRLILCDTGLYGSTQRLLADGFPDRHFETVQFARSNYKGHDEEHFSRVTGLIVERNLYTPLDPASSILRYWQLIESLFEPGIPSVRSFSETPEGKVVGNCGPVAFGEIGADCFGDMLNGALDYVRSLPGNGGAQALADSDVAWRRLRRAILRPDATDVDVLSVGPRSVDFGRSNAVEVLSSSKPDGIRNRLASIKTQLWREGAITREFPVLKHALLPALSTMYVLRALRGKRHR